jgi:non-ribosomal peptide synthetase component F
MLLYAGWAIVMSRLSDQEDVTIGTPIANRQRAEFENLVGFFVNTLALRIRVKSELIIDEFLLQVKETTLAAYEHQDVPFEKVVEALQPARSLSRNPLFQVMMMLQNVPKGGLHLPELTPVIEDEIGQYSMFDLHLMLSDRGDEVSGALHYALDLFDRETAERWAAYYRVILRELTSKERSYVADLAMIPKKEYEFLTQVVNATHSKYACDLSIDELIEARGRTSPHSIAVVHNGNQLTYAQLNHRANQLAAVLRRRGVGPEAVVAVCIERGLEMVVGVLGVLKTGAAYLPLDPDHPSERLAYILEDSAPRALLTQKSLVEAVLGSVRAEVIQAILIDEDVPLDLEIAAPECSIPPDVGSRRLAYVIYTSGSTGRPKGVMVEHRGVVNLLLSMTVIASSLALRWHSISPHWNSTFRLSAGHAWLLLIDRWSQTQKSWPR